MIINYEQVVAGALLKFRRADNFTISFIIQKLQKESDVTYIPGQINELKNIVVQLNDGFGIFYSDGVEFIFDKLQEIAGSYIIDFINRLDLKELVIRKVNENCDVHSLSLTSPEIKTLDNLYAEGYLEYDIINFDFVDRSISLTQKGFFYLYMANNEDKIKDFRLLIQRLGFRDDLLEEYLKSKLLNNSCDYQINENDIIDF